MRVLLIYPNIIETPKDISMGLACVSAMLKQNGHTVDLIDTTWGMTNEEILAKATAFNPEVLCITVATNDFKYGMSIIDMIKEKFPNAPVVVGGYHATMAPQEVLDHKTVDMVCVGEGDSAIAEVVDMIQKGEKRTDILNIWFKDRENKKTISNVQRQLPQMNDLPIPDRTIFDYQRYVDWHNGTATFVSTRGCPYPCTYCINRKQKEIYSGMGAFVRYKSVDKILAEIKE